MEIYQEERVFNPCTLIARKMDIAEAIEELLKKPNFALWYISSDDPLNSLHTIREKQLGGNTQMVPGFQPYISDPSNTVPGACIVESSRVLYSPEAIPLHENRDSYTMSFGDGKNFYTTMTFSELLRSILAGVRTLHMAQFRFSTSKPVAGEIIELDALLK